MPLLDVAEKTRIADRYKRKFDKINHIEGVANELQEKHLVELDLRNPHRKSVRITKKGFKNMISKNSKTPERALELLDEMMEKGEVGYNDGNKVLDELVELGIGSMIKEDHRNKVVPSGSTLKVYGKANPIHRPERAMAQPISQDGIQYDDYPLQQKIKATKRMEQTKMKVGEALSWFAEGVERNKALSILRNIFHKNGIKMTVSNSTITMVTVS